MHLQENAVTQSESAVFQFPFILKTSKIVSLIPFFCVSRGKIEHKSYHLLAGEVSNKLLVFLFTQSMSHLIETVNQ